MALTSASGARSKGVFISASTASLILRLLLLNLLNTPDPFDPPITLKINPVPALDTSNNPFDSPNIALDTLSTACPCIFLPTPTGSFATTSAFVLFDHFFIQSLSNLIGLFFCSYAKRLQSQGHTKSDDIARSIYSL